MRFWDMIHILWILWPCPCKSVNETAAPPPVGYSLQLTFALNPCSMSQSLRSFLNSHGQASGFGAVFQQNWCPSASPSPCRVRRPVALSFPSPHNPSQGKRHSIREEPINAVGPPWRPAEVPQANVPSDAPSDTGLTRDNWIWSIVCAPVRPQQHPDRFLISWSAEKYQTSWPAFGVFVLLFFLSSGTYIPSQSEKWEFLGRLGQLPLPCMMRVMQQRTEQRGCGQ